MSRPVERFACVYAREFPVQALLRLRPELRGRPCAVLEGTLPSQRVCSCNARALSLGVEHGMTPVELETIPAVIALTRSTPEEASTRAALLECIGSFSPSLEELTDDLVFVCVADIAGTERLHGQPASLARLLIDRMGALGIAARVAIARQLPCSRMPRPRNALGGSDCSRPAGTDSICPGAASIGRARHES